MSFVFRSLLLGLMFWMVGCDKPAGMPQAGSSAPSESVKSVLEAMVKLDVNPDHYPSYAEYHDRVNGELTAVVKQLSSASELKILFVECYRRWKVTPEAPQDRLQWLDPHCEVRDVVIFRLADMKSEEAAKVLAELYADETISFDGGFSLDICNAITRCGRLALPHLIKLDFGDRKERVQLLISYIEKGRLYGP